MPDKALLKEKFDIFGQLEIKQLEINTTHVSVSSMELKRDAIKTKGGLTIRRTGMFPDEPCLINFFS